MKLASEMEQLRNKWKEDWQAVRSRMNERRVAPVRLAAETGWAQSRIEEGIHGEPIPIPLDFIRACVRVFHLLDGRAEYYGKTLNSLSYDECMELIKPQPAMPPMEGDFWERDEDE